MDSPALRVRKEITLSILITAREALYPPSNWYCISVVNRISTLVFPPILQSLHRRLAERSLSLDRRELTLHQTFLNPGQILLWGRRR